MRNSIRYNNNLSSYLYDTCALLLLLEMVISEDYSECICVCQIWFVSASSWCVFLFWASVWFCLFWDTSAVGARADCALAYETRVGSPLDFQLKRVSAPSCLRARFDWVWNYWNFRLLQSVIWLNCEARCASHAKSAERLCREDMRSGRSSRCVSVSVWR